EPAMPLAQHDLLALGMLQVNELLLVTPEGDVKADDVLPESQADGEVGNMQLGDHVGPAGFRRSVRFGAHIDIFHRCCGNRTIMTIGGRWGSTGAAAAAGEARRRRDSMSNKSDNRPGVVGAAIVPHAPQFLTLP